MNSIKRIDAYNEKLNVFLDVADEVENVKEIYRKCR